MKAAALLASLLASPLCASVVEIRVSAPVQAVSGIQGLSPNDQLQFVSDMSRLASQMSPFAGPGLPSELAQTLLKSDGSASSALEAGAGRAALTALLEPERFLPEIAAELRKVAPPSDPEAGRRAAEALEALSAQYQVHAQARAQGPDELKLLAALVPESAPAFFDGLAQRRALETQAATIVLGAQGTLAGASHLERPGSAAQKQEAAEVPAPAHSSWKKHAGAYGVILGVAGAALANILSMGQGLIGTVSKGGVQTSTVLAGAASINPLALFALQVAVIVLVGRISGKLLSRFGQPAVIGEVIGGLILGPSLLGLLFPMASAALFPAASLGALGALSQLGLAAFMFIVGLQIDTSVLKKQTGAAAFISHTSIILPFILGSALALPLFASFAPAGVPFLAFSLFMGIAMSITAFPVLARILHERKMTATPLGSLALACAAIDDVTAWGILAFVVGIARSGSGMAALPVLGGALVFVAAMVGLARPFLARTLGRLGTYARGGAALGVLGLSALAAQAIGIHALFGAFLAGAIMPRDAGLQKLFEGRFQKIVTILLLPIFFALTGLRTQVGLLNSAAHWAVAAAVIAAAVLGKLGGGAAAARFSGMKWRDALSIGALMNTRGLVELVVLNIGYDLGIISAPLFAILVIMALATTAMTGPLLTLFARKKG